MSEWLSIALFVVLVAAEAKVFWTLRGFKDTDSSILTILLAYTVLIGTKMVAVIVFNEKTGQDSSSDSLIEGLRKFMDTVNMIVEILVNAMIFYFIV